MIFSELYSAYYNAIADILSGIIDGEHNEKELQNAVVDRAFGTQGVEKIPGYQKRRAI